jgi:hypothetical protein
VELLARDPALRQTLGEAGRERVLKCFDLADQMSAFENLYHDTFRPVVSTAGAASRECVAGAGHRSD